VARIKTGKMAIPLEKSIYDTKINTFAKIESRRFLEKLHKIVPHRVPKLTEIGIASSMTQHIRDNCPHLLTPSDAGLKMAKVLVCTSIWADLTTFLTRKND